MSDISSLNLLFWKDTNFSSEYTIGYGPPLHLRFLINAGYLILLPLGLYVFICSLINIKQRKLLEIPYIFLFMGSLLYSATLVAIMFLGKMFLFGRIWMILSLTSILLIGVMYNDVPKRVPVKLKIGQILTISIILLIVLFATFQIFEPDYRSPDRYTHGEKNGLEWCSSYITNGNAIFSDKKIVSGLFFYDLYHTHSSANAEEATIIYYNDNTTSAVSMIDNITSERNWYFIITGYSVDSYFRASVQGPTKPISQQRVNNFNNCPYLDKIYDSGNRGIAVYNKSP